MDARFTSKLEALLQREVGDFKQLLDCQQLTAGASQETYRVSFETDSGQQLLALRRAQPLMGDDSGVGSVTLETEARLLELAGAAGIPEPEVIYILSAEDGLGRGFLMQWLDGETLGQRITRGDDFARLRPRLAYRCGQALARLHALDLKAEALDGVLPTVDPARLVEETWRLYRDLNIPVPMIDYCWRWLHDNLPEHSRQTLVHGDFRNGNIMVDPQGIVAVLDWELAHIGDPVRDLGWLCVNSWRFGQRHLPVGGFGEREDLIAGYRDQSGIDVSLPEIHYWEVFGSFWWSVATLTMAHSWRTGETPSLERPVIGRRSSEAQMDCVNLLIPGEFQLPDTVADFSRGTQLPMPAEMIQSVADFLKQDVAAQLEPRESFLARVAANSLGIAQRELLHGGSLAQAEKNRLHSLLGASGELDELRWQLLERLRDGLPLDTPGLAAHLRQTVAGQLAIDQPRYSALSSGEGSA